MMKHATDPRITGSSRDSRVITLLRLIALVTLSAMTVMGLVAVTGPAQAKVPGPNGQIVFSRFNGDTGNADVFVANPDGTNAQEVPLVYPAESEGGAFWSPDGTKLLITNVFRSDGSGGFLPFRPATVNPDGSDFNLLDPPGAPEDMFCTAWSPAATRIL
jgi:Tol biopolymer transport system component